MALLSTLVDDARVDLGEDTGTASADSMLTDAMFLDYYNRWGNRWYKEINKEAALGSLTTTSGTTDYAVSSVGSVGIIQTVYRLEGNRKRFLSLVHPDDNGNELVSTNTTTNVELTRYSTWGNGASITFPDGPTTAEIIYLRYHVTPTAATSIGASVSFQWDDVFWEPFLTYVRAHIMRRTDRGNMWQTELGLSAQQMRQALRMWRLRSFGDGPEGLSWRQY